MFAGLPSPLRVARYHSLVIAPETLPPSLRVLARADDDGEIMAVEHREHPVVGVQFHPGVGGHAARLRDGRSVPARRRRATGLALPTRADGGLADAGASGLGHA